LIVNARPQLAANAIELAVNIVFDSIGEELARNGRVEVRGFGSFSIRNRRARQGRNPRTGEPVAVVAKRVPFFTTGVDLANRVNEGRLKYPIANAESDG